MTQSSTTTKDDLADQLEWLAELHCVLLPERGSIGSRAAAAAAECFALARNGYPFGEGEGEDFLEIAQAAAELEGMIPRGYKLYPKIEQPPLVARRKQRQPRQPVPGGLLTRAQAAARLGCSVKTLNVHIASGALKYVALGHSTKRQRKMFTAAALDDFIANQTRKDVQRPSTKTRVRRTDNLTSSGRGIAFSAQPKPQPGGKRKR